MLRAFDPLPSNPILQKKVEYFFMPYNKGHVGAKHMRFEHVHEVDFDSKYIKEYCIPENNTYIELMSHTYKNPYVVLLPV